MKKEQTLMIQLELSYEQVTTVLASINVAILSIDEGKWPQVLKDLYKVITNQRTEQAERAFLEGTNTDATTADTDAAAETPAETAVTPAN
jgi:hypothetical protein